jgi:hypothetical protein
MVYITYKDLVVRYGNKNARDMIRAIETLAQIQNEIVTPINQNDRLQRALDALNEVNFAIQK